MTAADNTRAAATCLRLLLHDLDREPQTVVELARITADLSLAVSYIKQATARLSGKVSLARTDGRIEHDSLSSGNAHVKAYDAILALNRATERLSPVAYAITDAAQYLSSLRDKEAV